MSHSVQLSWDAVSGTGVSYNVYRGATSGGESKIATVDTNSFTDTNPPAGESFYYVTVVEGSESGPSNEVNVTIPASPAPPTNLVVVSFS